MLITIMNTPCMKKRFAQTCHIFLAIIVLLLAQNSFGQNPFMPPTAFVPDGEPHVFEYKGEKRLFVYGSRDERITGFCGYGHDVWSAPIDDLTKWTNHGEIFNVKQVKDIGYGIVDSQHFGAPDCVYNPKTKKYYLYTFLGASYKMDGKRGPLPGAKNYVPGFEDFGPKCVMAVSDSPAGPFTNPVMCDWPPANQAGTFDPSAIVEPQEDGSLRVFVYWGMKKGDRWAEVDPADMHTIINPITRKPDRTAWHTTLDSKKIPQSSFFEASSIKKIDDDHYIFIYSSNELKSGLTYCYAKSPKGPWNYGGVIVRNNNHWKRGNNHGSIVKIKDDWYVVYHKPTFDTKNRQAMMEPIEIITQGEKLVIPEVEMTSQGVLKGGLDPFKCYNINIACYRTGNAYIDTSLRHPSGLNPMVGIDAPASCIGFKYFDFGRKAIKDKDDLMLKLYCKVHHTCSVLVYVATPHQAYNTENHILIAESDFSGSLDARPNHIIIPVKNIKSNKALKMMGGLKGKLAVFIEFKGQHKGMCDLYTLEFSKHDSPTPNPLHQVNFRVKGKGKLQTIPEKARVGESVKLSIAREFGEFKLSKIYDEDGKEIQHNKNGLAPDAPITYNFFMPNSDVTIEGSFDASTTEK